MYLVILFMVLALASFQDVFHDSTLRSTNKTLLYCAVLFVIILLSGLRWEKGTDWEPYYVFHLFCTDNFFDGYNYGFFEPGFVFLNSFNKYINASYTYHLLVMSIIITCLNGYIFKKYSVYPFVSLLVWLAISICNIFPVRQTIAISILCFSIKSMYQKRKLEFTFLLILAILFHYTSIAFAPAYFFFQKRLTRKRLLTMVITTFAVAFLMSSYLPDLLMMIGGEFFNSKLSYYLNNTDNTFGALYTPSQILLRGAANRALLFLIPYALLDKERSEDRLFNGIFNLFAFGTCIFFLLVPTAAVLTRMVTYYDVSQILLIPYFFKANMPRRSKLVFFALIVMYLAYRLYGVVINYAEAYLPYKSIFS